MARARPWPSATGRPLPRIWMPRSRCRIGSGSGSMSAGAAWSMPSPEARARPRDRPRLGADPPGRDRAAAGRASRLLRGRHHHLATVGTREASAADGKNAVTMATGELPLDRPCRHQSILGNIHTGRLVDKTMLATGQPWCRKSPASAGSMSWTRWSWITAIRSRGLHRGRHLGARRRTASRRRADDFGGWAPPGVGPVTSKGRHAASLPEPNPRPR